MGTQTIWTQAGTAILAALNANGSPATAFRARFETIDPDTESGLVLNLFPTKVDCKFDDAHDSVGIDATFVVRGYVGDSDDATVDVSADVLVLWAWKQLRADPTLGQLVSDVYVDNIELGYVDKSASDQVCVDITIRVEVEVDRNDPSVNKTYLAV